MNTDSKNGNSTQKKSKDQQASRALVLCALIPFLFSIVFHTLPSKATVVKEIKKRPALIFQQYAINLPTVELQSVVKGRFSFTNSSDKTVKITSMDPSCGCLNPRLNKKVYEPGEHGYFDVRVSTPNSSPGKKEYTIDVNYSDPEPQTAELNFKFTLPEKMVLVRPFAIMESIHGNMTFEKKIKIIDFRKDHHIRVHHVECISLKKDQRESVPESIVKAEIMEPAEIDSYYASVSAQLEKKKLRNKKVVQAGNQVDPSDSKSSNIVLAEGKNYVSRLSDEQEELEIERECIAGVVNLVINNTELDARARFLVRIHTDDPDYPVITVPLHLNKSKPVQKTSTK